VNNGDYVFMLCLSVILSVCSNATCAVTVANAVAITLGKKEL